MNLIPAPPIGLRSSFLARSYLQGVLFLCLGVGLLGGATYWQGEEIAKIIRDRALWTRGVDAVGDVKGSSTTHNFILTSYHLDVDYEDGNGARHHGKASFSTMFKSVDKGTPVTIRYDPKAPDSFVLSWAVDLAWSRWVASLFLLFVILAMGLGSLVAALSKLKSVQDARRCLAQCEEISVEVTSVVEVTKYGRKTGVRKYWYRFPSGVGDGKSHQVTFGKRLPLFTDSTQRKMLSLHPPLAPERAVVLREDLYPFRFSAEVAQLLREKTQASQPA